MPCLHARSSEARMGARNARVPTTIAIVIPRRGFKLFFLRAVERLQVAGSIDTVSPGSRHAHTTPVAANCREMPSIFLNFAWRPSLFSDAKGGEDQLEDILVRGCAGEGVQAAQGFVEIEQEHLVRGRGSDRCRCSVEPAQRLPDRLMLPQVRQHSRLAQPALVTCNGAHDRRA